MDPAGSAVGSVSGSVTVIDSSRDASYDVNPERGRLL
jgi:hypothetical protein